MLRPVERRPESQERPEGEWKKKSVVFAKARRGEDRRPEFIRQPAPVFRSVEPSQTAAAGSSRLVTANISLERLRQVRAVRGTLFLIVEQIGLRGEGKFGEVVERSDRGTVEPGARETALIEGIARKNAVEPGGELRPLELT